MKTDKHTSKTVKCNYYLFALIKHCIYSFQMRRQVHKERPNSLKLPSGSPLIKLDLSVSKIHFALLA